MSDREPPVRRVLRRLIALATEKVLAPVVATALGAVIVLLLTQQDSEAPAPPPTHTAAPATRQPLHPPALRGRGTEPLRAAGHYGQRPFRARGAVVIPYERRYVGIQLHPQPIACENAFLGTPEGLYFEAWLAVPRGGLHALPLRTPLHPGYDGRVDLSWVREHASSIVSDSLEHGAITLTTIDTHPGGFWRGRISTHRSRTLEGRRQQMRGTFAARWCDDLL